MAKNSKVTRELKTKAQERLESLRKRAYDDFYVFTKYVLGYDLLRVKPHREICEILTDMEGNKRKLLMVPRDCFKSTIATISLPLWLLWHNPNERIMLDNESFKNSKRFLAEMKGHIERNELLRAVAINEKGDYLLEPNRDIPGGWTEEQVKLKMRVMEYKEPSILCSGADTNVTGMHPTVIIMDDLVSERNVTTKDQIEKVKHHYRMAYSLLKTDGGTRYAGLFIVIGTRYHLNDLYQLILTEQKEMFDIFYRPAILPGGELFFPGRLSHKKLEELRKLQGSHVFNSQYMLNPLSPEDAVFRPEWFRFYKPEELPRNLYKFILVDLAISQRDSADYTVVGVFGVDEHNDVYLIEYQRGRFTPPETMNIIFGMHAKHEPLKIGIESTAWQKAMIYFMRDEMRRRGKFLPLVELKADTDKVRRAMNFQPWVENGAYYMPESERNGVFHDEMLKFSPLMVHEHDDCVDVVSYLPQIMRRPPQQKQALVYEFNPRNAVTGY